jgi:NAD-dependent deacetylase
LGKLIVFTGAGISAESGISTFRDANGLWENHKIDEVCNIWTWKNNFEAVHAFYNARRLAVESAQPNAAHRAVKEWQDRYETVLLTQNIDDLFEKAGCRDVIHLHGEATRMMCQACGSDWDIGYREWKTEDGIADRCPKCNSRRGVKPGVIFFHEAAPLYRVLHHTLRGVRPDDVIVVIGTSAAVIDIGSMLRPIYCRAKILNNLEPSPALEEIGITFFEPATQAVGKIDTILRDVLG